MPPRPKTRGAAAVEKRQRQKTYENRKTNIAAVQKNRERSRKNQQFKKQRLIDLEEATDRLRVENSKLNATIRELRAKLEEQYDRDETIDQIAEDDEQPELQAMAKLPWHRPVSVRVDQAIKTNKDWHQTIGLDESRFFNLVDEFQDKYNQLTWDDKMRLEPTDNATLPARDALYICLYFLRQFPTGTTMQMIFDCHPRTLTRVYRRVLGALRLLFQDNAELTMTDDDEELRAMKDPSLAGTPLEDIVFFVDGTIIKTARSTRKGKDPYYSGAKTVNGVNLLAICDSIGKVHWMSNVWPASNVDQGIWNRTNVRSYFLRHPDIGICGDGGFTFNLKADDTKIKAASPRVVKQTELDRMTELQKQALRQHNTTISKNRVIIENVFGRLKDWKIIGSFCRHYKPKYTQPNSRRDALQINTITQVLACIHNRDIIDHPVRGDKLEK